MAHENHGTLWWRKPAKDWIQSLPIGDGRIGGRVFGGTAIERIALNEETIWTGRPQQPDISGGPAAVEAIRRKMLAGDRTGADALASALQGPFTASYQPLGDLWIDFDEPGSEKGYRNELDLSTGVVTTRFVKNSITVTRRAFVSSEQRALIVLIDCDASVTMNAWLQSPHPVEITSPDDSTITMCGFAPESSLGRASQGMYPVNATPPGLHYGDDGGVGFASALTVSGAEKTENVDNAIRMTGKSFCIRVTAATTFKDWRTPAGRDLDEALRTALAEARDAETRKIADLVEGQRRTHGALYSRTELSLATSLNLGEMSVEDRLDYIRKGGEDPSLLADIHNFSRYLLIASSAPGSRLPATLQGLWNESRTPPWFSSYTTNINIQMNYFLAEQGNLSECADVYIDYVDSIAEAGERTARDVFGFDGWCANHNTDAWRATWPAGEGKNRPTWSVQATCGIWMAMCLTERDAFAPDPDFLRKRMLPLFEGACRFALDLLIETPDGLRAVPSTSPENNYRDHAGNVVDFDIQTTFDYWLVSFAIDTYLDCCDRLGIVNELTQRCRDARSRIGGPEIGPDGRLQEWSEFFEEPEPQHRHMSHLIGLYPGTAIDPVTTPDLANAVGASIRFRMAHGSPVGGWSHAWMVALLARLYDAETAKSLLENLIRKGMIGDGLSYITRLGVHQIDANFGLGAGISEMLLQSHRGVTRPLPALPESWDAGKYHGFRVRGGLTANVEWASGQAKLELIADRDVQTRIAFPTDPARIFDVSLKKGGRWNGTFSLPSHTEPH